jgi:uncharacterized protein YbjT (DUF2867 family)
MKVILFGATGMIGQGVLRECLLDPDVDRVLAIVRRATGQAHEKLHELVHADFSDYSAVESELAGYDACCYCLGVSSAGMSEPDYTRVTYDFTLAAAEVLARQSPGMTFIYVSGAGTDSTEQGRSMWARVKGRTENALLRLPFRSTYLFRPAFVQPLGGIVSRTPLYRAVYAVLGPLYPVWRAVIPGYVTTTEAVGKAMLEVAKRGAATPVLENSTINALGRSEQRGG